MRTSDYMPGEGEAGSSPYSSLCPDWRGPTVAVDPRTLALRFANVPARQLLDRGVPARVMGGRIAITSQQAMRRLAGTMKSLLVDGLQSGMVVVDDADETTTYALRIALPSLPPVFAAEPIALIDFAKASLDLRPAVLDAIGDAFDLTPAEGSVLGHLAAGLSLREIAALRDVRIETVRHQCKTILGKMRCRRQSDLVRIVAVLSQRDPLGSAG